MIDSLDICEDCKCSATEENPVTVTNCPYAEDIDGIEVRAVLCEECYYERCMDI